MIAIYARESLNKKDSMSIETQIEHCKRKLGPGDECRLYTDKGFSSRPDFTRMMEDIRGGGVEKVIVYKLDCISRSILDFEKMMEVFKQYSVEFVSSTENFDTTTPIGRAMLNVCIVFAQMERESA